MKKLNITQRNNHDFEVLFKQQQSLKRISTYKNIQIVKASRRLEDKYYSNTSLLCIHVTNPVRKFLIRLVLTKQFDYLILAVILANCAIITLPELILVPWQDMADLIFLSIYTCESALKIICMGFISGKYSYLRDSWNVLDFIVMGSGWIGMIFQGNSINVIRTIRILRPLRTFNSVPEMKTLIVSIFRALPLLLDIFLLFIFCLFVFALIGIQIYGGLFTHHCFTASGIDTGALCYIQQGCQELELNCGSTCDKNQYCWKSLTNPNQNISSFDNIFLSIATVFIAVTLEGWSDIMRFGRKVLNQKFFSDIYFVALVLIVAFFMAKLTVAAIYVKFTQTREEQEIVKEEASFWESSPDEPFTSRRSVQYKWYLLRLASYKVINHEAFEWVIVVLITINTCVLASEYYLMSSLHDSIIDYTNMSLTVCFGIEMALKVLGLGLKSYLSQARNIFDGLLVFIGLVEIATILEHSYIDQQKLLRAIRILRLFKAAKKWPDIQVILDKLVNSTKSICYLGLITFITIFIYTLLGKKLFQGKMDDGQGGIPRANFENFYWSFVTVFNLVTLENWNTIFYNAVGPNGWTYSIYFFSLIVIGGYILLNLFIAILIDQFEENKDAQGNEGIDLENTIIYKNRPGNRLESKRKDIKRRAKIKYRFTEIKSIKKEVIPLEGYSFFLFSSKNKLRKFCRNLIIHPYFDSFIYSLIVMSCASLMVDEPESSVFTEKFIKIYSWVTLGLFILEFMIKSVVFGFIQGKNSYIHNGWNILDLTIIIFSIIDEALSSVTVQFAFVKAFRAVRALRPLRMISHNENMRKVISSVFAAIPAVLNVLMVTFLFYIVFGIIGVIFFKGIMHSCSDASIVHEADCVGSFVNLQGISKNRKWVASPYNFDDIFHAILTLFSISTLEAWPIYMYAAVDGVGPGESSRRDYNQFASLYYIAYIFLTNFFIMNLYLGAVIKKFNEIQEEIDGSFFLSSNQKEWVKTQKLMINCYPKIRYLEPKGFIRKHCYRIALDFKFEYITQTVIVLNIIFMSLFNYPTDSDLIYFQEISNLIFVALFSFEFLVKVIGLGVKYYFASKWNRFDFCVLIISILSAGNYLNFSNGMVLRALKISRLFRIFKVFKSFQSLIKTLVISLPSLLNVGAILCLLWFVYGVAGTYLFSHLDYENSQILSDDINFKTFYNSIMTLFQSITGENWNLIMLDCMGYYCDTGSGNCGNHIVASIYWVSYTILGEFFFLNLFIAVILENFTTFDKNLPVAGLNNSDLKKYQQVWSIYAPYGEETINTTYIPAFLQVLDSPLGFKNQNLSNSQILHIVLALGITDSQGKVHFAELLWKLAHSVSGTDMSTAAPCEALRSIQKTLPKKMSISENSSNKNLAANTLAAFIIINKWRKYRREKLQKQKTLDRK